MTIDRNLRSTEIALDQPIARQTADSSILVAGRKRRPKDENQSQAKKLRTETKIEIGCTERQFKPSRVLENAEMNAKEISTSPKPMPVVDRVRPKCSPKHEPDLDLNPFHKGGEFADHGDFFALRDISRRIMIKTEIDGKPLPRGKPRVWADGRQALCETVLYYQAWQGACYINKGVLMSFMLDSNGHERDLIDEDVIIARAGGGMTRDRITSRMVQCRDQKENHQTDAVRTAIASQTPIVIFCGSENSDIATRMPHRYSSLAWYKATHVWTEINHTQSGDAYEQIKYRFEKLSASQTSWWMPVGPSNAPSVGDMEPPLQFTCNSCRQTCQKIYLQGWMCLNPDCRRFWTMPGVDSPYRHGLTYDPRFLKQKTTWVCETPPYDMRPALPSPAQRMGDDVAYAMTRGICCPECGKCTSRYLWRGWLCSHCGFRHQPSHVLIPPESLRDPYHPISYAFAQSTDWADRARVSISVDFTHNYRVAHYQINGIRGRITHMLANRAVVEEAQGPDAMFTALQSDDMDVDLERRRFSNGRQEYMTAFSGNRGMPYKFIAAIDSKSFEGAPWPLTQARSRLNWAARTVLTDLDDAETPGPRHDFNELLTIGYFDGQIMRYHDDGETGLGPTVASLSLGGAADMFFRVKAKHNTGVTKTGVMIETPPLEGTLHCEARRLVLESLRSEKFGTRAARVAWLQTAARQLGLNQNNGDRKPWLRLRLSHGDMVIMHGREIQEYMEHQVEPLGSLRFALTCRTILADHLRPDEMPSYRVGPDEGCYDGSGIRELRTTRLDSR